MTTSEARDKAGKFVARVKAKGLDKAGWTGAFWDDEDVPDGQCVLEVTRAATSRTVEEKILQAWEGGVWIKGLYKAYDRSKPIKNTADALRIMAGHPAPIQEETGTGKRKPKRHKLGEYKALPPSFDGMTDQEVLDSLYGKVVTFRRGIDGVEETVTIPPRYRESDDGKRIENDVSTHRIINFLGGRPGEKQFRAVNINNIVSLG